MPSATIPAGRALASRPPRAVVGAATLMAFIFIAAFVLPYLTLNESRFQSFWPRRWWLLAHLGTGTAALLLAPLQIWIGTVRRRMQLHRRLGWAYLTAIALSAIAAVGLAIMNDVGWVYGVGLVVLATAWITTSSFAFTAIRRGLIDLHREWMIRSAVVTFAFVWFRIVLGTTIALDIGTFPERLTLAAWSCWSVPLLVTEVIIQSKKLRQRSQVKRPA